MPADHGGVAMGWADSGRRGHVAPGCCQKSETSVGRGALAPSAAEGCASPTAKCCQPHCPAVPGCPDPLKVSWVLPAKCHREQDSAKLRWMQEGEDEEADGCWWEGMSLDLSSKSGEQCQGSLGNLGGW